MWQGLGGKATCPRIKGTNGPGGQCSTIFLLSIKVVLACLSKPEPETAWLHFLSLTHVVAGGLPLIEESSEPSKEMSAKETHITHLP